MMRSLYSGFSGMRTQQTGMDIIGNNIANVNTTGYKAARVVFEDMLYQSLSAGSDEENPIQVGGGSRVGAVDTLFGAGAPIPTGNLLDLAIVGNGFLVLNDAASNGTAYTRSGNLSFTKDGYLVHTTSGMRVMGWKADAAGNVDATGPVTQLQARVGVDSKPGSPTVKLTAVAIDESGKLVGAYDDNTTLVLGQLALATFPNNGGLQRDAGNLFTATGSSGAAINGAPGTSGRGKVSPGSLEMSNVDLTQEFSAMILSQRAFQANSRVVTTTDELLQEIVNLKR